MIGRAWLAVAAQFAALTVKRYAPYPDASERGLGPIRSALRSLVLAQRARKRAVAEQRQRAAGG